MISKFVPGLWYLVCVIYRYSAHTHQVWWVSIRYVNRTAHYFCEGQHHQKCGIRQETNYYLVFILLLLQCFGRTITFDRSICIAFFARLKNLQIKRRQLISKMLEDAPTVHMIYVYIVVVGDRSRKRHISAYILYRF